MSRTIGLDFYGGRLVGTQWHDLIAASFLMPRGAVGWVTHIGAEVAAPGLRLSFVSAGGAACVISIE